MDDNKKVYDLINGLDVEQNILFALSCINRIKHLPQLFINTEKYAMEYLDKIIPKEIIESTLTEIIDKVHFNKIQSTEIDKTIELLEELLLDDDIESCVLKQLFSYYVLIIINILKYIKENKNEYIELCSDDIREIINQAKSDEYCKKNNKCTDKELNKHIELIIDEEVKKEIEIIKIIKDGNKELLNEYIKNNKIEYNI